ncbi:MAG: hypothetical protein H0X33_07375 [Taibaiella sp.]|nr:hypothetical protein [Taibaiella sp.]
MIDLEIFQKFETKEEADEVKTMLESHGVQSSIEGKGGLLDANFVGNDYNDYFLLMLWPADFERAQLILMQYTVVDIDKVDKNYMLFTLSDIELMDVIAKPDEWGIYNYKLAKLILQQRGKKIDEVAIHSMEEHHLQDIARPRSLDTTWIVLGYTFSILTVFIGLTKAYYMLVLLYGVNLFPGIVGIILGRTVWKTKKTLPNGERIYSYTEKSRMHGCYMMWIGVIGIAITIIHLFI